MTPLASAMVGEGDALKGQAMVVVREVLHGVLTPALAQSLLFDALDTLPKPPEEVEEWLAFAQGPLHQLVTRRVGMVEAAEVSERVHTILSAMLSSPAAARRASEATSRFERRAGPTRVLVLAPSPRLARMLKAVLGPKVATMSVTDVPSYNDVVHQLGPSIFLIDLTEQMNVEVVGAIEGALAELPAQALVLIWDQGTQQGKVLARTLGGCGHSVAWVDRREGVEPLLDHIRARSL
ncbi:MAG: hypothetical protein AB8H86_04670 [Polyangiales bacterium]